MVDDPPRVATGAMNNGYRFRHVVPSHVDGQSVDNYLASTFPHSSLDQWRSRIENGEVEFDGQLADLRTRIRCGCDLVWNRPPWQEPYAPCTFGMLFADEAIIVVDKPSGLPTLPGGGFYENTLLNLVRKDFQEATPVHRLGRGTSGLVVLARSREAAAKMTRDWGHVAKTYRALMAGTPAEDYYDCLASIGPYHHPLLGHVHAACPNGKPSRSEFWILNRREENALAEVNLHTGRPHQIRIHAAFLGHPLVGDPLYGKGGIPLVESPGVPGDLGYLLHAHRIRFHHPIAGIPMAFEASLPKQLVSD
jgi:23S rRNA pseudouridine1911/1915/1917 synthase